MIARSRQMETSYSIICRDWDQCFSEYIRRDMRSGKPRQCLLLSMLFNDNEVGEKTANCLTVGNLLSL